MTRAYRTVQEEVAVLLTSSVPLMLLEIGSRNPLHPIDFDLDIPPARRRVGHFVYGLLVHLHAMDGETGTRVELLMADVTLEVLRLLMLDEDLLIVELSVAVPVEKGDGMTERELTFFFPLLPFLDLSRDALNRGHRRRR